MHNFLHKYAMISSKIGKIRHFSHLIVLKSIFFFFFCINMLLFCLILTNFRIFVTNCQNINFLHIWYFLNPQSFCINTLLFQRKPAKYVIFRGKVPNFRIKLHSIPSKIRKLSPPIISKKWPQTLRNRPALHKN